ncbi:MAG: ABC transporter ATP-binding protein [Actinobacteria bacterium]|nr:ABC transporter ATP-binding protein [Actinomycetota bacterium]
MDSALLQVRSVSKSFGGLRVLHDCSFGVPSNDIVGLIGPNGAGKTTLFNIISGFLPADAGEVVFAGDGLTSHRPDVVASMGVMRTFQTPHGFSRLTVMDNMLAAAPGQVGESPWHLFFSGREVRRQSKEIEIKATALLVDFGLWERQDELVLNLPLAEARLLEFARQLMGDPRVLLLDEPAAGLNRAAQQRIADVIIRLKLAGMTMIIIEHNLSFIMHLADRIVVLNRGKIIAEGTSAEVASNQEVIKVYLGARPEKTASVRP